MWMWIVNWKLHLYALSLSYFKFWTEQSIIPKPWEAKLCLDAGNRNCDCGNPFIFNCDIPFIGFSFDSLLTKWLGFLVFVAAVAVLGNAEGSSGGTLLADVVFLSGLSPFSNQKITKCETIWETQQTSQSLTKNIHYSQNSNLWQMYEVLQSSLFRKIQGFKRNFYIS